MDFVGVEWLGTYEVGFSVIKFQLVLMDIQDFIQG
jgi:hypothetical protein